MTGTGIKITVMMLLISQAIIAQNRTAEEIATKRVEKLEKTITLSPEQKTTISSIVTESTAKMMEQRKSGAFDKDVQLELKKEERKKIKEVLTDEQRQVLKDTKETRSQEHKQQKSIRMEKKAQRMETKNLILDKRADFNTKLSSEEIALIENARSLQPERVKGKEAKAALTEEQKAERKAATKEIHKILKPIVKNHQTELDTIKSEIPAKPSKKDLTEKKKGKNKFAYKFLLME